MVAPIELQKSMAVILTDPDTGKLSAYDILATDKPSKHKSLLVVNFEYYPDYSTARELLEMVFAEIKEGTKHKGKAMNDEGLRIFVGTLQNDPTALEGMGIFNPQLFYVNMDQPHVEFFEPMRRVNPLGFIKKLLKNDHDNSMRAGIRKLLDTTDD